METTLLLVDDHPLFRQGLHLLLDKQKDLRVVGEAGDGQTAIELARKLSPDVVVMDITMPNLDGIEATRRILAESPQARIVALSIHGEKQFVENMLGAGAAGYILKESVPEELVNGIRTVAGGEIFLSETITEVVVSHYMSLVSGQETRAPADETNAARIITTKLHRPPLAPDLVSRLRVLEYLNGWQQRPLTLISAGPGYGKSTLVSNWLDIINHPSAWLSLDERDDDLVNFLTYFIAAVQTLRSEVGQKTLTLAQAATLPPLPVLAASLANELDRIETPFILVLDDYHHIRDLAIHDLLTKLLHHPPPLMHLVIVTRRDPPLALPKLRARGQMIEIGYQDLRFTVAETAAFLQMVTQLRVEQTTAALLEQKTEGWVTGLRLSALSLRHKGDLDHLLRNLPDNIHYVTEYLMSEVVLRRSPAVQEFLLKTAILDRFCTPLTDAVCAPGTDGPDELESGSQAILARLQQENLFVIPLDDQRHWFRYHHQFQELLLQRLHQTLTPEGITELHRRAGEWFAENNLIDEALRYTLAAGDISHVVHLVEQHRYDLMNTEQWQRLERWLKLLSPKTIEKNPMLLLTQAFIYEYRGQIAEAFAYRDQAEGLLSTLQPESLERKALEGEIAVLCAEQLILSGEGELAVESATRALELLPPEALHSWSYAIGDQVLANQMAGDIGRGLKIVNEILNKRASLPGMAEARMMLWFCIAYWMEGDLNGVKQSALRCLKLGEQHALPESIGFGRYFLGVSHYIRNELAEAERYLTAVVDDPFTIRPYYLIQSASALALIYTSQGRDEKASNVVESMISHTKETHDTLALATTQAFHVDLALRQGKALEARRLSEQAVYDLLPPLWFFYMPQLTPVRLLLAQNTPESLRQALTLLDPLDEYLAGINRKTIRVDVLALQALVLNAQGEEEKALAKLTESVSLARLGGFIRNFVDMGDPMVNLLARLKSQSVAPDYIDQILAAFRTKDERQRTGPPPSSTVLRPSSPLIEPLSNRELEVLELLVRRLSDKEIGQHLFISTQTVKKHNARIFQKLSVKNRREAVAKAGALGILPND